jgi:hypothetical protein
MQLEKTLNEDDNLSSWIRVAGLKLDCGISADHSSTRQITYQKRKLTGFNSDKEVPKTIFGLQ